MRRYDGAPDSDTLTYSAAGLPAGASIDLWVADAGYLVALEIAADGTTKLGIDVSNVNDPANVVTAPAG